MVSPRDGSHRSDGLALVLLFLGIASAVIVFLPAEGRLAVPAHAGLAVLLGQATFLLPLALVAASVTLLAHSSRPEAPLPGCRFVGAGLLVVAALPAEHLLSAAPGESLARAEAGGGTGVVGHWLASGLLAWLGQGLTAVVLASALLAGVLLAFDIRPASVLRHLASAARWCRRWGTPARGGQPAPPNGRPSRPARPVASWRLRTGPSPIASTPSSAADRPPVTTAPPVVAGGPVALDALCESAAWRGCPGRLRLGLGLDATGAPVVADLARMPHLLVAGGSQWRKRDCLNAIVASLAGHLGPDQLRLLLIDTGHDQALRRADLPHLLCSVVSDADGALNALEGVLHEMDRRYTLFTASGVRDIVGYGYSARAGGEPLPYLVVVVDDLADVIVAAGPNGNGEDALSRLAQFARATGIHLVVATATPRQDVITDRVRRDFPARLAFAVPSEADSRTILDQAGAERLVADDEALFLAGDATRPVRLRAALVSEGQLAARVDRRPAPGVRAATPDGEGSGPPVEHDDASDVVAHDEVYEQGAELAERVGRVSVVLLQRRLGIEAEAARRLRARLIADGVAEA